jgi:hypothetical protein
MLSLTRDRAFSHTRRIVGRCRVRRVPLPSVMTANTPSGQPATNGLSMELWKSVQREVYMSLHDPFVQGLAQGTLDRWALHSVSITDNHVVHACK